MTDEEILRLLNNEPEPSLLDEAGDYLARKGDIIRRGATSVPTALFGAAPAALTDATYSDLVKSTDLPADATTPEKYLYKFAQGAVTGAPVGMPGGPVPTLVSSIVGGTGAMAGQAIEDLTGSPTLGLATEMFAPAGSVKAASKSVSGGFKPVETAPIDDEAAARIAQLESEGLTGVTRAQATGLYGDKLVEQILTTREPAKAGATLIEGAVQQGQQILDRILTKSGVGDRVMLNPKVVAENAGKAWQGFVAKSVNDFHTNMQKVYDRVPNVQIDTMPLFDDVNELMQAYKGNEQATKALQKVFRNVAEFEDGVIVGLKPTTVKEFWNIKRSIADGMFKGGLKNNPFFALDAGETAKIRKQILGSIYRTLDEAAASGNVGAEQLKKANAAYQAGVKQLDGLRARPINDLLGEETSKALQGGQWNTVVQGLKDLSPEDSRMFVKLMEEQSPDSLAMLRRETLNEALMPFQRELTMQDGTVKQFFDLTAASPTDIMKAINESPLYRNTKEAKRIGRLLTKLQPAFKATDPSLMAQVDTGGRIQESLINVLADFAGTALPRNMAYRARYAVLSAGASKRIVQMMARDPMVLAAIAQNPKAERLFVRLSKDENGYRALSQAATAERDALLDAIRQAGLMMSGATGLAEMARDEATVTDDELLQMLQ